MVKVGVGITEPALWTILSLGIPCTLGSTSCLAEDAFVKCGKNKFCYYPSRLFGVLSRSQIQ